jgi:hypothetical protein
MMADETAKWGSPHGHAIANHITDKMPQVEGGDELIRPKFMTTMEAAQWDTDHPEYWKPEAANVALDAFYYIVGELQHYIPDSRTDDLRIASDIVENALQTAPTPAPQGYHVESGWGMSVAKGCKTITTPTERVERIEGLDEVIKWCQDVYERGNRPNLYANDIIILFRAARAYLKLQSATQKD